MYCSPRTSQAWPEYAASTISAITDSFPDLIAASPWH